MSFLDTGRKTKSGVDVKLGDILKGDMTNEVVVMNDEEMGEIVVEDRKYSDIWHPIDEFLTDETVKKVGSILERPKNKPRVW